MSVSDRIRSCRLRNLRAGSLSHGGFRSYFFQALCACIGISIVSTKGFHQFSKPDAFDRRTSHQVARLCMRGSAHDVDEGELFGGVLVVRQTNDGGLRL